MNTNLQMVLQAQPFGNRFSSSRSTKEVACVTEDKIQPPLRGEMANVRACASCHGRSVRAVFLDALNAYF